MSKLIIFKTSNRNIENFDTSIKNIVSKLKKYKLQYPDLSNEELFEKYKEDNIELLNHLLSKRAVRSDTFRLNAINSLLASDNTFRRIYSDVIRDAQAGKVNLDDISKLNFNLNSASCQRTHVIDGIYCVRKEMSKNLAMLKLTPFQFERLNLKKLDLSTISKDTIETLKYLKKSEYDRIVESTKLYKAHFESNLKENYIQTLMYYYEYFKKLGYMDNYLQIQMKKYPSDLQITFNEIDEFFTPENLNQLGITELAALYAFYSNRFTKELQEVETLNFCLAKGYSIDEFMEAEDPSKVIPEFMKAPIINEQDFIAEVSDNLLCKSRVESERKQSFLNPDNTYSSTFDLNTDIPEDIQNQYVELFGKKKTDFYKVMSKTFVLRNHTSNQYVAKDASMLSLLSTIATYGNKVQNWGIILDKDSDGNEKDKLNVNSDLLLLGFDIKGLNMPLRLHIPTDMVKDFSREYLNSEYFPVYEGDTDFKIGSRHLPTHILMKQPNRILANIKTKLSKKELDINTQKLYSHLLYLNDPNETSLPDHLKTPVLEGKKGNKKQKLRHIKRYVSLKSGTILNERQLATQLQK